LSGGREAPCPNCREKGITVAVTGGASSKASMSGTALLRHNLDITWFRIAVEHERVGLDARSRAAVDDEMRAAMVAVVSSAFAMDAMGAKVAEMLGDAAPSVKGRISLLVETFKVALDLGPRTQAWQVAIRELFAMRGAIVHFVGEATPGLPHPTGTANVSKEAGTYTIEAAAKAVDLALEILTVAHRQPRRRHAALVEWAERDAHIPAYLEAIRRGEAT
jgi:hypothetical protein